jgi:DNA-binding transcriptional MerR regulator
MGNRVLRIGHVAAQAGVSPDTVRHYERLGVIPKAVRTAAGYREYSESALERIRFVRHAVRFGFSLKQIGSFLRARESGHMPCREVRDTAARMAVEMDQRIEEMVAARTAIQEMLGEWDQRLAAAATGKPARLLETLTSHSPSTAPQRSSGLNRRQR